MKVSELRKGNLVFDDVLLDCKVESVFRRGQIEISIPNGELDGTISKRSFIFNISQFQPILLTVEWLNKFGFEETFCLDEDNEKVYMMKLNDFVYVNEHQIGTGIDTEQRLIINSAVKYVHQLQNLYFAICGEEITIKN